MAPGREWWLGLLVGWYLLCLASCSDNGTEDNAAVTQTTTEPTMMELGLRLAPKGLNLAGLSPVDMDQVIRGSYLVNGAGNCAECHTTDTGYLAGGVEFPLPPLSPDAQGFTSVLSRNLTPDPETGLLLTEDEFIEAMRTGKDFHDSAAPQRLIVDPWPIFRFLSRDDLRAIYAFLRRIPPVRNAVRNTFQPPLPLPPVVFPAIGDGDPINDPDNAARGLLIPQFFSSGSAANTFVRSFNTTVNGLTPENRAKVGRGSYLVNAIMNCNRCHTESSGVTAVDVNAGRYLAGGVDINTLLHIRFKVGFPLLSRNLTPATGSGAGGGGGGGGGGGTGSGGLSLTETEFIQSMRFGADFRRPGGALRIPPHFPTGYELTLDDLKAIFAYLQAIPIVTNRVEIVP